MFLTKDNGCRDSCDVLVIDDDPDVLDLLLAILTKRGVSSKVLTSGKDLVVEIGRSHPRLLLLDVRLPGFNGYALCDLLKNEPSAAGIPIYFITALPAADVAWHVAQCGAAGFIQKPFTLADIDNLLAEHGLLQAP
ncbi:MAG: response regulator [Candidatus Lokiarchaeota archaeon]|nr:response regulator [Candidatus Lokiarchaeota archaeon]